MWPKERLRICKRLFLLAGLVAVLAYCSACSTLPYAPPYPEYVLEKADPWINSIRYLPDAELQAQCAQGNPVLGCASLLTGEIFVIADPDLAACVVRHERSHFYEVFVMGIGVAETQSHKHWHQPYCYRPMRASGSAGLVAALP